LSKKTPASACPTGGRKPTSGTAREKGEALEGESDVGKESDAQRKERERSRKRLFLLPSKEEKGYPQFTFLDREKKKGG